MCKNSKNKNKDLSFHTFPSDPNICKKWIINSGKY